MTALRTELIQLPPEPTTPGDAFIGAIRHLHLVGQQDPEAILRDSDSRYAEGGLLAHLKPTVITALHNATASAVAELNQEQQHTADVLTELTELHCWQRVNITPRNFGQPVVFRNPNLTYPVRARGFRTFLMGLPTINESGYYFPIQGSVKSRRSLPPTQWMRVIDGAGSPLVSLDFRQRY